MNLSQLNNQSLQTLAQQWPNHLTWTIFSSIASITNTLIVLTIFATKELRNKSQFVIASHSISEVVKARAYFCTGMARFLAYVFSRPETSDQLIRILKQFPLAITGVVVEVFGLALASDRLMCFSVSIFYKIQKSSKYLIVVNALCWGYPICKIPFAFMYFDRNTFYPICNYVTSFDPRYVTYSTYESNILTGVTVGVYMIAASILFYRYKKATFGGVAQKKEWKKKMEFDVFIAVSAIGAIYVGSSGAATITNTIFVKYLSLETIIRLGPFGSFFGFTSSMSHLIIYLRFNTTFRRAFTRVILRKDENSVTPLALSSSQEIG